MESHSCKAASSQRTDNSCSLGNAAAFLQVYSLNRIRVTNLLAMTTTRADEATTISPNRAKPWFTFNAVVAWLGLAVSFTLTSTGMYPSTATDASQIGYANATGAAGALGRIFDWLGYFTIWSNLLVAVVLTLLALNPHRDSLRLRVLRIDTLMMISITGIIYAAIIAPYVTNRGWEHLSNALVHQITPILTILVFIIAGPRGWFNVKAVFAALIVPIVYVIFTLIRGAVIGAYPYSFFNVAKYGYNAVLINVIAIAICGLILAFMFMGIDRLMMRRHTNRAQQSNS
jgi:hypothetical protein